MQGEYKMTENLTSFDFLSEPYDTNSYVCFYVFIFKQIDNTREIIFYHYKGYYS